MAVPNRWVYRIQYRDFYDRLTQVAILSINSRPIKDLKGTNAPLIFSADTTDDDVFSPIQSVTAYVKVFSETNFQFSEFTNANPFDWGLEVYKDLKLIFKGYLAPGVFTQPYLVAPVPVELAFNDGLAILKQVPFLQDDGTFYEGKKSLLEIIRLCLYKLPSRLRINTAVYIKEQQQANNGEVSQNQTFNVLEEIYVDAQIFKDVDNEELIELSCYDVLSRILKPFGCQLKQDLGEWWITQILHTEKTAELQWAYRTFDVNGNLTNARRRLDWKNNIVKPTSNPLAANESIQVTTSRTLNMLDPFQQVKVTQKLGRQTAGIAGADFDNPFSWLDNNTLEKWTNRNVDVQRFELFGKSNLSTGFRETLVETTETTDEGLTLSGGRNSEGSSFIADRYLKSEDIFIDNKFQGQGLVLKVTYSAMQVQQYVTVRDIRASRRSRIVNIPYRAIHFLVTLQSSNGVLYYLNPDGYFQRALTKRDSNNNLVTGVRVLPKLVLEEDKAEVDGTEPVQTFTINNLEQFSFNFFLGKNARTRDSSFVLIGTNRNRTHTAREDNQLVGGGLARQPRSGPRRAAPRGAVRDLNESVADGRMKLNIWLFPGEKCDLYIEKIELSPQARVTAETTCINTEVEQFAAEVFNYEIQLGDYTKDVALGETLFENYLFYYDGTNYNLTENWNSVNIAGQSLCDLLNFQISSNKTTPRQELTLELKTKATFMSYFVETIGTGSTYVISRFNYDDRHCQIGVTLSELFGTIPPAQDVPSQVLVVNATGLQIDRVTINWQSPLSDGGTPILYYRLYRLQPPALNYQLLHQTAGATILTYTDDGLMADTLYRYYVVAVNSNGESNIGTIVSITTKENPLTAVRNFSASSPTPSSILLTWTEPEFGIPVSSYSLVRQDTEPRGPASTPGQIFIAEREIATIDGTATSYLDTSSIAESSSYLYYIQPNNVFGAGPRSNNVIVFTDSTTATVPGKPDFIEVMILNAEIYLQFFNFGNNDGGSPVLYYNVYRSTTSGSGYSKIGESINPEWYDFDVVANTQYYYVVTAVNRIGESVFSDQVTTNSFSGPAVRGPINFTATINSSTSVTLNWERPGGGLYSVSQIFRQQASLEFQVLETVTNDSNYTDTTVIPNVEYTYWVRGIEGFDIAGIDISLFSNPIKVITGPVPAAPRSFDVTVNSPTNLTMTWLQPANYNPDGTTANPDFSDLVGYQVLRRLVNTLSVLHTYPVTPNLLTLNITDHPADAETYYYTVRAENEVGSGPESNIELVITDEGVLVAPSNLTVLQVGNNVKLDWQNPVYEGVVESFVINRVNAGGGTTLQTFNNNGTATTYLDIDVATNPGLYRYQIAAARQPAGFGRGTFTSLVDINVVDINLPPQLEFTGSFSTIRHFGQTGIAPVLKITGGQGQFTFKWQHWLNSNRSSTLISEEQLVNITSQPLFITLNTVYRNRADTADDTWSYELVNGAGYTISNNRVTSLQLSKKVAVSVQDPFAIRELPGGEIELNWNTIIDPAATVQDGYFIRRSDGFGANSRILDFVNINRTTYVDVNPPLSSFLTYTIQATSNRNIDQETHLSLPSRDLPWFN